MATHVINPNQLALFTGNFPKRQPVIPDRMLTIGDVKREGSEYDTQRQQQQPMWEAQYGRGRG